MSSDTKDGGGAFAATSPLVAAEGTAGPRLAVGTLLGNRWSIKRFLAEGGMGEVYEADDKALGEVVALKTLRREVAASTRRLDRFRREIQLARRVTHANVCRIFEMGTHEELTFFTMELVRGETLAHRVRERGRMTADQALPIVEQLCAALAAAHAVGVVHRDFKSANVLLDGARAVVTDFGLARSEAGDDAGLTQSGDMLGTPAYMAPEQVVGGTIGPAADVYALGIVLYEMVTGALPFAGDTPMAIAARRLDGKPPSPRRRVPELDAAWEATIVRCLALDPEARPTVAEVAAALRPRRRTRTPAIAAGIVAVAVLAVGGALLWRRGAASDAPVGPPTAGAAEKTARRSLAVMGFKNLTGRSDQDWMSSAFVELLTVELSGSDGVRLVAGEAVSRAKLDLALTESPTYAADTLQRVRSNLGADFVLAGSYLPQGGQIDLVLHVQDASTGELAADVRVRGADTDLAALAHQAAAAVRDRLGAGAARTLAALPANPEVVRLYSEGVEKLRREDHQGARDSLKAAVAIAPDFAMGHYYLAVAWSELGYDPEAQAAAARAFELAANLPRDQKLLVEAQYRGSRFEWDRQIDLLRALFDFYPDDVEYGIQLARAQLGNSREADGKATIARLRAIAPDDLRVAALAYEPSRDPKPAEDLEARARAVSARLTLATILLEQSRIYYDAGDDVTAQAKFDEGQRIYGELHSEAGQLDCLMLQEHRAVEEGDLVGAAALADQALALARRIGNAHQESNTLHDAAVVHAFRDELDDARRLDEEALAIRTRLCRRWCQAHSHYDLAFDELLAGHLDAADAHLTAAEEIYAKFDIKDALRRARTLRARLLLERGKPRDALALLDELAAEPPTSADDETMAGLLRGVALARLGDRTRARELLEAGLATARKQRSYTTAMFARTELARLANDRAELAAIGREAHDKQYFLIERRALLPR